MRWKRACTLNNVGMLTEVEGEYKIAGK